MQGLVIVVDGASSVGKTSVIKQLMPMLDSSYQYVAVDDFVTEVFLEQGKLKLPEEEFFERIMQQGDVMHEKVQELISGGKNVVLETVLNGLESEKSVRFILEKLKNMHVFMVLVHCPLPVLVERIKQRNENALLEKMPGEERAMVNAISQFEHHYRPRVTDGEVFLGTLLRTEVLDACESSKGEFGNNIKRFNQFKRWLLSQLGVKEKPEIVLTTRLKYDSIVNTAENTPQECAQKIKYLMDTQVTSTVKKNLWA